MFPISVIIRILLLVLLKSRFVQLRIPVESIDYWIGNISPRCALSIIYIKFTTDFTFNSTHDIPVMLIPLIHYPEFRSRIEYLQTHKFFNSSLRFLKAECYFSVIYYKTSPYYKRLPKDDSDNQIVRNWLSSIAYGFPYWEYFDSNSTYSLILYHGKDSNDKMKLWLGFTKEFSMALIFLPHRITHTYTVYCRHPSTKFEVAVQSVPSHTVSLVNQKFMNSCSGPYRFVGVAEQNIWGDYDPLSLVSEHEVITYMLLKINASIALHFSLEDRWTDPPVIPIIIINDNSYALFMYPIFDSSIRVFTCYSPPVLSFHFYISAFERHMWISIVLVGVVLATFLNLHIHYNINKNLNFSSLLLYFSIFMEESFSIPTILQKDKVYRVATILWLLTACVLTNIYISHVISGLNSPLQGEKLTNINDLYEKTTNETDDELKEIYYSRADISSKYVFNLTKGSLERIFSRRKVGFTFLSEPIRLSYPEDAWLHIRNAFIYNIGFSYLLQAFNCWINELPRHSSLCHSLTNLLNPSYNHYPPDHSYKRPWKPNDYARGAVEEELVQCQKSVYLERSNQLEFKYMSENYKQKRFYYLKEGYSFKTYVWGFHNLQKSRLPFYFSLFLQSGVYHQLHKIQLFKDHQKRKYVTTEIIKRTEKPLVLDMKSSVQTIFILFLAMSCFAKLVYAAEHFYSAFPKCLSNMKQLKCKIINNLTILRSLHTYTLKDKVVAITLETKQSIRDGCRYVRQVIHQLMCNEGF